MSDTAIQGNQNTAGATSQNIATTGNQNAANAPERLEPSTYYTPLVDIIEKEDSFIFKADVPGVRPEDVDIRYENGVLILWAQVQPRQPPDTNYIWREYGVGPFYRQFIVGVPVDPNGISAELKNGELTLTVPKAESAKTHKIPIKSA